MKPGIEHSRTGLEVAIIGMACRFPGANNQNEFWQNLLEGKESITQLDDEMLLAEGIPEAFLKNKNYVKSAFLLDNIKCFDATFFDIPPLEVALTDPQQRFLMEVVWEALEDSGYNPKLYQKKMAIYAGGGINTYLYSNLIQNKSVISNVADLNVYITNHVDSLATRIAYKLGLEGPAVTVQSACSTSLVATHLACQGLLTGDAEIAIAAGVKITVPHYAGYQFQEDGIKSKDGHCRPFDENATGTVFGNGIGVLILKLLDKAIEDNDNIYAIIKGSAINNDGNNKMNYASPGIAGQTSVIQEALRNANICPSTISYIETHGTATQVGDPIEIAALTQAIGDSLPRNRKQYCAIGSVKSNLGHLDVAAGMASLIKTALALKHKLLPASINFSVPNKQINFQETPFYVNTTLKHWDAMDGIRRAGISGFGLGGTNAHIILEEFDEPTERKEINKLRILPLSAKTEISLNRVIHHLIECLSNNPKNVSDVAYTLSIGRHHFPFRKAILGDSTTHLIAELQKYIQHPNPKTGNSKGMITWFFCDDLTSKNAEWKVLYQSETEFREKFNSLFNELCHIERTSLNQLTVDNAFSLETSDFFIIALINLCKALALAKMLLAWNVLPNFVLGNWMGIIITLYLSNCLSLREIYYIVQSKICNKNFHTTFRSIITAIKTIDQPFVAPILSGDETAYVFSDILKIDFLDKCLKFDSEINQVASENLFFEKIDMSGKYGISGTHLPISENIYHNVLSYISNQWENGHDLNWEAMYRHEKLKKISLPTYAFNKTEYWISQKPASNETLIIENNIPRIFVRSGAAGFSDEKEVIQFIIIEMQTILGVSNVQPNDNFFELGGDSLTAIDLAAKIEEQLGVKISVTKILSAPTPERIAKNIFWKGQQPVVNNTVDVQQENIFPLSQAEKRFWLSEHMNPQCSAYCVPVTFQIEGSLSLDCFQLALQQLAKRQECFHNTFKLQENRPVRIVNTDGTIQLEIVNCITKLEADSKAKSLTVLVDRCRAGFNLEKGPLARAILLQYAEDKYFFGLVLHHILVDGHSMTVLIDELSMIYRSLLTKEFTLLPPVNHALNSDSNRTDFVTQEMQNKFWQNYLDEVTTKPTFLHDFPHSETATVVPSRRIDTIIYAELLKKLSMIAAQEKSSLFVVLLSAWLLLIYRYTEKDDFIVGYPINQRWSKSAEKEIGPKINTIPFRAKLSRNVNFLQLIHYVHSQHILLLENSTISYEEIVETILNNHPKKTRQLINNFFVYQNTRAVNLSLPDVVTDSFDIDLGYSQHDITLILVPKDKMLNCTLEYNTHLFQHENMQRVLDTFLILLQSVVEDPSSPISHIKLCNQEQEYQKILMENVANLNASCNPKTVIELFEQQVAACSHHCAVKCIEKILTYRELNAISNQFARYLIQRGCKKGGSIIVQAGRDERVLVALLAILKIGGIYIPMAPSTLSARRRSLVQQIKPQVILTDQVNDFEFNVSNIPVVPLHAVTEELSTFGADNLNIQVDESCLAYILFTSGSTGEPKGVKVTHRALVNNICWRIEAINLGLDDKVLHTISFTFDPSLWQFLGPICSRGCVVIADDRVQTDIDYFISLVETHKITVLDFTPSLLRIFLKFATSYQVASVRHVFCGGETIDHRLITQFFTIFSASMFNQYGPTETTIDATYWRVDRQWFGSRAPIGKPINSAEVYVLDHHHNICPVGALGELYIGGKGLAEGYLNDPELTNAKFIYLDNLFTSPKRLYKTGDLARYLASGDIEYCGRRDNQIKINGIRVDLQELENIANLHPVIEISCSQVDPVQDLTSFILYIQIKKHKILTYEEFISFLQSQFPGYMVPKSIRVVEDFPYTESGKIDRKSLGKIPSRELNKTTQCTKQMSETEKLLVHVFSEVLQIDSLRIDQNVDFFAKGGNSLRAIYAISRIRKIFYTDISVEVLFKHPILADLARFLEEQTDHSKIPPLENSLAQSGDLVAMFFSQEYIWRHTCIDVYSCLNNVPVFLKLQGNIDMSLLEKSIDLLIEKHDVLRTYFLSEAKGVFQKIVKNKTIVLEKHDLTKILFSTSSEKLLKKFSEFVEKPFVFSSETLFRCGLFSFINKTHILVLVLHRLIYDGRSDQILVQDIVRNYRILKKGDCDSEFLNALQYRDFIEEEKLLTDTDNRMEYKASVLAKQISSYRMQIPFEWKINLPIQEVDFKVTSFELERNVVLTIENFIRVKGITHFVLFMAVVQRGLSKWLKHGKYLLATPTSGRLDEKFFNVMGRFVNLSLLPVILNEKLSMDECIQECKQTCLSMLENQTVPIQHLIEKYKIYSMCQPFMMPDIFVNFFDESSTYYHDVDFSISRESVLRERPEFPIAINIAYSSTKIILELKYITAIEKSEVCKLKEMMHEELIGLRQPIHFPQIKDNIASAI